MSINSLSVASTTSVSNNVSSFVNEKNVPIDYVKNITTDPATLHRITSSFQPSSFSLNFDDKKGAQFKNELKKLKKAQNNFKAQSKKKCRKQTRRNENTAERILDAARNGQPTVKTQQQLNKLEVNNRIAKTNCDVICQGALVHETFTDPQDAVEVTSLNNAAAKQCIKELDSLNQRGRRVKTNNRLKKEIGVSGMKKDSENLNKLKEDIDGEDLLAELEKDKSLCEENIQSAMTSKQNIPKFLHAPFDKIIQNCDDLERVDNNIKNLNRMS